MVLTHFKAKGSYTKMLIEISVRYLKNDMIKPFDNGGLENVVGSVIQKFLISGKKFR